MSTCLQQGPPQHRQQLAGAVYIHVQNSVYPYTLSHVFKQFTYLCHNQILSWPLLHMYMSCTVILYCFSGNQGLCTCNCSFLAAKHLPFCSRFQNCACKRIHKLLCVSNPGIIQCIYIYILQYISINDQCLRMYIYACTLQEFCIYILYIVYWDLYSCIQCMQQQ